MENIKKSKTSGVPKIIGTEGVNILQIVLTNTNIPFVHVVDTILTIVHKMLLKISFIKSYWAKLE